MATINDLLKNKGNQVWSVSPNASVIQTLQLMAEKDVGAILVLEGEHIAGIVSERDFVRAIAKTERCTLNTTILEYMTTTVVTVDPDTTLDECMKLMTDEHFRHLPVLKDGKPVGLISIGDLVKDLVTSKESTIDNLQNYIEGRGYGS